MGSVADLSKIEMKSSKPPETALIVWYQALIDSMSSVDELVSGKWSYKQNADGMSVRNALTEDGLEQKHQKLLKIRNAAYDILKNGMPDCSTSSRTVAHDTAAEMKITIPLCSVISSCNYDDKILAYGNGCVLGAPNLETDKVLVGGVYFSMPAIPIAPMDYGTTVENLQVPIGFVSGLVGGEAGKAIATLGFALQNCPAGSPLNPDSSKTMIFCIKPDKQTWKKRLKGYYYDIEFDKSRKDPNILWLGDTDLENKLEPEKEVKEVAKKPWPYGPS